jgi:D-beta-D-heptose 7-phosphate kinase/D-beta-D-heptose 1-phosphate adenosyltransferase
VIRPDEMVGILDRVAGERVLVVGDAILDVHVNGSSEGLCREAPVPAVTIGRTDDMLGGAANTAVNVAALGGDVTLLTHLGDDEAGERLQRLCMASGLRAEIVTTPGRRTVVRRRICADGHALLRLDEGCTSPMAEQAEESFIRQLTPAMTAAEAVIICDYEGGTLTARVMAALAEHRSRPRTLVVDAKDPARYSTLRPTAVTPNRQEASRALALGRGSPGAPLLERLRERGDDLLDATGADMVALTLDTEGAVLFQRNHSPFHDPGWPDRRPATRVGLGDAFAAALTLALVTDASPSSALTFAAAAASVAGERVGTALCHRSDLRRRLGSPTGAPTPETLAEWAASVRARGLRIVLTNGCFDLLHDGHLNLLTRAKALGDVLVVGVNDDEGVRRLKGEGRPVVTLEERLRMLAALGCVDHAVPFCEDTAASLIDKVRPAVYVKGADYSMESLPEAAAVKRVGARVQFLHLVPERSTSRIIRYIRERPG